MKLLITLLFITSLFSIIGQNSTTKKSGHKKKSTSIKSVLDSIDIKFSESRIADMKLDVIKLKKMVQVGDSNYYHLKSYEAILLYFDQSLDSVIKISKKYLNTPNKLTRSDLLRFQFAYTSALALRDGYQNKEAKSNAIKIEEEFSKANVPVLLLLRQKNLVGLGNMYYYEGKFDSVNYYIHNYRNLLDKEDFRQWADYYALKANVEIARENYYNALFLLKRASKMYEKVQNEFKLMYTYYNTGDLYRGINNYDSVYVYLKKAEFLAEKRKDNPMIGYISSSLAEFYMKRKEYDLAYVELKKSEKIFYDESNFHGLAHCVLNLSLYESDHKKNHLKAIEYVENALVFANKIDDAKLIEVCYEYLGEFHERAGNYKKATEYLKLFNTQIQKVMGADVQANIDDLEVKYNTKLVKERNKSYKSKIKAQRYFIKDQWNRMLLLILCTVILIIIVLFIYKNYKKTVKINTINKELNELKLIESKNVEKRLVSELQLIQKSLTEKSEINKLLISEESKLMDTDQIKKLISNDNDWVNFILKIKLLFPGFIEKLEDLETSLTINEFRLAALVKFGLSDKEIADILCVEHTSVKKAKVRLKKKLNLDPDQKLKDYLNELAS